MAKDPYRYFRIEARELIDGLGAGMLVLEKSDGGPATAPLLRLAHTLKGAARVVRQVDIADLAHEVEEHLEQIRLHGGPPERVQIDTCLNLVDRMRSALGMLGSGQEAGQTAVDAASTPQPVKVRAVRIDTSETDILVEEIAAVGRSIADARLDFSLLDHSRKLGASLVGILEIHRESSEAESFHQAHSIATELEDQLRRFHDSLTGRLEGAKRDLMEIRVRAERMRLLPADTLFAPLERVVRDAARELDREVKMEVTGGDIGIDASVLEALSEVFPHIMRNAVAHGVEAPEIRIAAGKQRHGVVRLRISRQASHVMITCSDDGGGIDIAMIQSVAVKRGLISDQQNLDEKSAIELLLRGGLSTSPVITGLSGRGLGLDIVRSTIESINGRLTMRTQRGIGTTLEVVVPLSVASIPALIAEAHDCVIAIPLDMIHETARVADGNLVHSPGGDTFLIGQRVLPAVSLTSLFGTSTTSRSQASEKIAVILASGDKHAALMVDRLKATESVIIRPLPPGTQQVSFLAGAGLDDAGIPRLVLDASQAVAAIHGWTSGTRSEAPSRRSPILVIDDSLTTRTLEQSILESAGYEVDVAISAEEALTMSGNKSYGLFVVDVEMPGMDGFTFVERTRAHPTLGLIPAILVTSRSSPADRQRGMTAGACAYIIKAEFDQSHLLNLIKGIIG